MVLLEITIFKKGNLVLSLFFVFILLFFNLFIFSMETSAGDNEIDEYFGDNMLLVGMIDLTLLFNNPSGNIEMISDDDQFTKEVVFNGRTVLFLKGKIKGKYLLTAKLDSGQGNADEIWTNLFKQKTGNTISRIDPERYYPVYGDNSSVVNMAGNQGDLYLNLTWDKTELLWGNYSYNINNNKLLGYNRSLYGFKFNSAYEISQDSTANVKGFWSKVESLHSYNELEMTGGILYYLKHGNLIVGSEELKIEVRDDLTGEVEKTERLAPGTDYDIDYLSGRVILTAYLLEREYISNDDKSRYLIANYEYEPIGNNDEAASYGLNLLLGNDGSKLSATYSKELLSSAKGYSSLGLAYDYQSDAGKFRAEWANTEDILSNQYLSEDGGISYDRLSNASVVSGKPSAYLLGYQTKLSKLDSSLPEVDITAGYTHKDKGFSSQREGIEENTDSYRLELKGGSEDFTYSGRYYTERKEVSGQSDTLELEMSKKMNEKLSLDGGLKQINKIDQNQQESNQVLGELDFRYQIDDTKEIYGGQELSLKGEKVNKTRIGAKVKPQENISLDAALTVDNSAGVADRNTLKLGGAYQYKYGQLYSDFVTKGKGDSSLVFGTSTNLNDQTDIYLEHKNDTDSSEDSTSNVVGLKYNPDQKWSFAFDYSRSNVIKEDKSEVSRDIITPSLSYREEDRNYRAKIEYRRDHGDKELRQYVLTSGFDMKYNEELSILFNLDYSLTERDNTLDRDDSFTEVQFGLAYRPIDNDRLNLLAMYTYQEEYKPEDQEGISKYDERSNIFSVEAIYDIDAKWQLGEKIAWKNSQIISKIADNSSTNENKINAASDTYLWINRLNYRASDDWDVYGEYRILENRQAEDRKSGFLVGVNKGLGNSMKLGLGYNFTDFNDDLTDLDYIYRGLFVNLVKMW